MRVVFTILGLIFGLYGFSQTESVKSEEFYPGIRAAIMMGNAHIPSATEGGKSVAIVPTWGFDVDYFFTPHWSVALQGDIKLQSFEVEDNGVLLERSYPFAMAGVIHYHLVHHWSVYLGPGYEFEKSENLALFKFGTEYSFEINENFEIALNLAYENKQDVYDVWTFGIAFNKRIWSKKR